MPDNLKIFLSSTQVDLVQARKGVIKFLGVLDSDLLAMEVFGSDESKPVDFCLRQVRNCNIFIGIYAERYGNVDPEIQKSITELEYIEASKMLKTGKLKGLLLYMIDSKATWPLDLIERDPGKMGKLKEFKEKILAEHTVSFFQNADDLPFLILRDVIRKIGISSEHLFRAKKPQGVSQKISLERPIGMEYYGEDLRRLFFGRDNELNALEEQILKSKMSLLIGSSGVGKTSLIYAGLVNRLKEIGWQTALVRPLTEPVKNLKRFLWDQLMEGDLPKEFDFSAVVNAVSTAHIRRQILIVIDQFEDILAAREPSDIEVIAANLLNIFNTVEPNLRMLISYRGDVEPHVGTIWQRISGSAQGLPRTYLGPLDTKDANPVLKSTLTALGITIKESSKRGPSLIDVMLSDLQTEGQLSGYSGIYPPFIQMLIARIFEDTNKNGIYHTNQYYAAGQSRRIIADYLMNQLKYLGNKIEIGKAILIALVSSYGTKAQKSLDEVSMESLLPNKDVERTLSLLIDLRLVRRTKDTYEISHDFLAKIITSELVSIEEREAKKFKGTLASRSSTYESTKAGLTSSEHLHIYKFRNKILCTEDEFRLLLRSYLSGNGPISYWAKRYPKSNLIGWTRQLLSEQSNEIEDAGYRFLMKLGNRPQLSLLAEAFSDYKEQHELARYIPDFGTINDIELLIKLNRKRTEEVAHASQGVLIRLISLGDRVVIEQMGKSKSRNTMLTFERVALNLGDHIPIEEMRKGLNSKELWLKLFSIYSLAKKGNNTDLVDLQNLLKGELPQAVRTAIIKTITRLAMRLDNLRILNENLQVENKFIVEKTLEANDTAGKITIKDLFPFYNKYPFLVSKAIYNISTAEDIPQLKRILSRMPLAPESRELVYALCKFGGEEEFSFLFKLFLSYKGEIKFWNAFAVVNRISNMATKKHLPLLKRVIISKEFWDYYSEEDRPSGGIPLADYNNIYFLKRLAGTAFGKIATRVEFPIIFKMLGHQYWIIRNAGLEAIRKRGNASDLDALIKIALETAPQNWGLVEAICLIDDKINRIASNTS